MMKPNSQNEMKTEKSSLIHNMSRPFDSISHLFIFSKIRRSFRGSSILQTRLKSLSSMDTATFDDKDVIC